MVVVDVFETVMPLIGVNVPFRFAMDAPLAVKAAVSAGPGAGPAVPFQLAEVVHVLVPATQVCVAACAELPMSNVVARARVRRFALLHTERDREECFISFDYFFNDWFTRRIPLKS